MSREPMQPFDEKSPNKTTQGQNAGLNDLKDRVTEASAKAKDKAGQVAETVSEKLGQQREGAADTLDRAASTIHDKAGSIPGGPRVVNFTHNIADGMESTASYLRDHDLNQMGKDVMNICRRYPIQSLIAALAVGFLIGRPRR